MTCVSGSKELGDHTRRLPEQLEVGDTVTVEGPYGSFNFRDSWAQQIWVGAGIGITPFIARMKELAKRPGQQTIDLFHTTTDVSEAALEKLKADAQAADIRLHLYVGGRDGRLNAERLRAVVPQWQGTSVWFCGPKGFGQSLRKDLVAAGLPVDEFHQELFEMR
jgi:predicted ferric reductase